MSEHTSPGIGVLVTPSSLYNTTGLISIGDLLRTEILAVL